MMRALLLTSALAALASAPSSAQSLPEWAASGPAPAAQANVAPPSPPFGGGAPEKVPVDGGLGLLALAGAGYAARRLRRRAR